MLEDKTEISNTSGGRETTGVGSFCVKAGVEAIKAEEEEEEERGAGMTRGKGR